MTWSPPPLGAKGRRASVWFFEGRLEVEATDHGVMVEALVELQVELRLRGHNACCAALETLLFAFFRLNPDFPPAPKRDCALIAAGAPHGAGPRPGAPPAGGSPMPGPARRLIGMSYIRPRGIGHVAGVCLFDPELQLCVPFPEHEMWLPDEFQAQG